MQGSRTARGSLARASALWSLIHGWSRLVIDGVTCFLPADAMAPASGAARAIIAAWQSPVP